MTEKSETEFEIGQKVVCVDARGGGPNDPKIVEGHIYTIEGFDDETEELGVYLVGVEKMRHPEWDNPLSWRATRFRPFVKEDHSVTEPSIKPQ